MRDFYADFLPNGRNEISLLERRYDWSFARSWHEHPGRNGPGARHLHYVLAREGRDPARFYREPSVRSAPLSSGDRGRSAGSNESGAVRAAAPAVVGPRSDPSLGSSHEADRSGRPDRPGEPRAPLQLALGEAVSRP